MRNLTGSGGAHDSRSAFPALESIADTPVLSHERSLAVNAAANAENAAASAAAGAISPTAAAAAAATATATVTVSA